MSISCQKIVITIACITYDTTSIISMCKIYIISCWTIVTKFYPKGDGSACAIDSRRDFISSKDSGGCPEIKIRSLHSDCSSIVATIGLTDSRDEIIFIWYTEIEVYIDRNRVIIDHLETEYDLTRTSRYSKPISSYFRSVTIVIEVPRII